MVVLLELVTVLEIKGRHATQGEIAIGFDCKKACKRLLNVCKKVINMQRKLEEK